MTFELQAKGNKGGSAAKKAGKGGNPLSGVGTNLPQAGSASKKASKAASKVTDKASKTANKAASKVCNPPDFPLLLNIRSGCCFGSSTDSRHGLLYMFGVYIVYAVLLSY